MKRFRWLLAASAVFWAGAVAGAGVASAHGEPCSEDPQDCGSLPTITNLAVTDNRAMHAKLNASISPGDQKTTFEIWISYLPCQGGAGECSEPVRKEVIASRTIAYKRTRKVMAMAATLTPGCTYGYWFVAHNGRGVVESEQQYFDAAGGEPLQPKECSR